MKYVHPVKVRNGTFRLYFRKANHPRNGAALTSPWPQVEEGSELQAEVAAILGVEPPAVKGTVANLAGAIHEYRTSRRFTGLGKATQYDYGLRLRELETDFGGLPLTSFTSGFCLKMMDRWALRGHCVANIHKQVMINVLKNHLIRSDRPNPFAQIGGARRPSDLPEPHVIWPTWVVTAAITGAMAQGKYGVARAIALARYAGVRRGDLIRLDSSCRKDGVISWLPNKARQPVVMPEHPELTEWLDFIPAMPPLTAAQRLAGRQDGIVRLAPRTLVFTEEGKAYLTGSGLGHAVIHLIEELFAAGKIDAKHYNLHGLRHSFGVAAALAGCTEQEGSFLMGHKSPNMFRRYTRQADNLRLSKSGMEKIAAMEIGHT